MTDETEVLDLLASALREVVYGRPVPFSNSPAEHTYRAKAAELLARTDLHITLRQPPGSSSGGDLR